MRKGDKPEPVPKPEALVFFEQIKSSGHLLFEGGLLDQPYITMMELRVCEEVVDVFEQIDARNRAQEAQRQLSLAAALAAANEEQHRG